MSPHERATMLATLSDELAELAMIVRSFQRGQLTVRRRGELRLAATFIRCARRHLGAATVPSLEQR